MRKIKALITLVVGKAEEVAPDTVCEVSDEEAKRLISLGFAEGVKNTISPQKPATKTKVNDNDKPDDKGGEQPVPEIGNKG